MAPDFSNSSPYTFLSCSIEPWDSPWLLHQPVMSEFAKKNRVMYVLPEPTLDQVRQNLKKPCLPPSGLSHVAPKIAEFRTSQLFPRIFLSEALDRMSLSMRTREVRSTLKGLKWDNPILYMWQPRFKELIGRLGERLSVFHSHDYYPGFLPEGSKERLAMEALYDEALRASDVVVACGQALFDDAAEARGGTSGVHLVENGVFFELLRGSVGKVVPKEFEGLKGPIVAYVGRINKTVNFRVLESIARARPSWSVVVMGPRTGWGEKREEEFRRLVSIPNVRYVEGRPASEIGAYLEAIDVGLISYENDGIKDFRFPLKMVEYFSFGKPVVSVNLSSIQKFEPLVRMVDDEADWVPAIEEALDTDTEERRARRISQARSMDWSQKALEILGIINARLGEKR